MSQHAASPRLSHLGNQIVAMMAHEAVTGGRLVRLQLLASQFYEAVKAELDQTPRHEAAKVSALAATADQCRRLAQDCRSPHLILVEVRAAVAMLSAPPPHQTETVVRFRPQLRVIQGGLA